MRSSKANRLIGSSADLPCTSSGSRLSKAVFARSTVHGSLFSLERVYSAQCGQRGPVCISSTVASTVRICIKKVLAVANYFFLQALTFACYIWELHFLFRLLHAKVSGWFDSVVFELICTQVLRNQSFTLVYRYVKHIWFHFQTLIATFYTNNKRDYTRQIRRSPCIDLYTFICEIAWLEPHDCSSIIRWRSLAAGFQQADISDEHIRDTKLQKTLYRSPCVC